MSLWLKTQQLQEEALQQVQALYGDHFPIEVRECLAEWIERNILIEFDAESLLTQKYPVSVAFLLDSLICELEFLAKKKNFPTKTKMMSAAKMFRLEYAKNPPALLHIMRHCLDTELRLVEYSAENANHVASVDILHKLEQLEKQTQLAGEDLRGLQKEQEAFQTLAQHFAGEMNINHNINAKRNQLFQMWLKISEKLRETLNSIEKLQVRVLDDELSCWKREQQLQCIGFPNRRNIYSIQLWCESLMKIIGLNMQQIREAELLLSMISPMEGEHATQLSSLKSRTNQMLSTLVAKSFIVEDQPPQVIHTQKSFMTTARLLVGSKLNLHVAHPEVTVSLITEEQAYALLKDGTMPTKTFGKFFHNILTMGFNKTSRELSAPFGQIILWEIDRSEKRELQGSADEKFALFFQCQVLLDHEELMKLWAVSLPVAVIEGDVNIQGKVKLIDESSAWATVTWDNAFAEPGSGHGVVTQQASWGRIIEVLDAKWRSVIGRSLTDVNKQCLTTKAVYDPNLQLPPIGLVENKMFKKRQFCKDPLPERNFSFWEWFYAAMELVQKHLRLLPVVGFIDRNETERLLMSCPSGTFMIRFSDSELGGLDIAWIGDDNEVSMLTLTPKDIAIRKLADRLEDLKFLNHLYPDIPKDNAFGIHYTRAKDTVQKSISRPTKPQALEEPLSPQAGTSSATPTCGTPCLTKTQKAKLRKNASCTKKKLEKKKAEEEDKERKKKAEEDKERKKKAEEQKGKNKKEEDSDGFEANINFPFRQLPLE